MAHRGTIFLDEISELSPSLQAKLLRVLQEREVMRVGGTSLVPVDVRVIAATNQDLKRRVQGGAFREDLFYRLAVLRVHVPPLRERMEDLQPLIGHLLSKRPSASTELLEAARLQAIACPLRAYRWPGNVRELENFVDNLVVILDGRVPSPRDLVSIVTDLAAQLGMVASGEGVGNRYPPGDLDRPRTFDQADLRRLRDAYLRQVAEEALAAAGGNRRVAARMLGVSRTTLWRRLKGP
jgi:transcriptional regulator with PAS, ATPase and Fis domain